MAQALAQVKRELGPNAIILHTRTLRRGGLFGIGSQTVVEISARPAGRQEQPRRAPAASASPLRKAYGVAAGPTAPHAARLPKTPPVPTAGPVSAAQIPLNRHSAGQSAVLTQEIRNEIAQLRDMVGNLVSDRRSSRAPNLSEPLFETYLQLIQQEVSEEIARQMLADLQHDLTGEQLCDKRILNRKLLDVLEGMIDSAGPVSLNLDGATRTIALIGPTGVGKTTTIAKLAAHFKLKRNCKVGLITIDTYRIGAVDQLRMYAQIIDVPLKVVLTPDQLREEVQAMSDMDVIFIDTAGRCQNDQIKIKELQSFLDAAQPDETHLVLSTTGHQTHMVNAAERFSKLGVDRVIFTKLDEAVGLGVMFSVLDHIDASLSYVTTGQDVPEDIEVGNGRRLATLLLGAEPLKPNQPAMSGHAGAIGGAL